MKIIKWQLPIEAPWTRALELKQLSFPSPFRLVLLVEEEESRILWQLTFSDIQAIKIVTEECAGSIFLDFLESGGGLFEVLQSPWIEELGDAHFLEKSHHYIICCYDQVIEVVAWNYDVKCLTNTTTP